MTAANFSTTTYGYNDLHQLTNEATAFVYNLGGQMLVQVSYDGIFYWAHQDHLGSGHFLTALGGSVAYRGGVCPT